MNKTNIAKKLNENEEVLFETTLYTYLVFENSEGYEYNKYKTSEIKKIYSNVNDSIIEDLYEEYDLILDGGVFSCEEQNLKNATKAIDFILSEVNMEESKC